MIRLIERSVLGHFADFLPRKVGKNDIWQDLNPRTPDHFSSFLRATIATPLKLALTWDEPVFKLQESKEVKPGQRLSLLSSTSLKLNPALWHSVVG